MATSAPLRLDAELVRAASAAARLHKRSVPRQVEFWAEIGRAVESSISAEELLAVREGFARLVVDTSVSVPVEPDAVLDGLEASRRDGSLSDRVCEQGVRYQRSAAHPGLLERVDRDGSRAVGRFLNGEFVPSAK